ncbi:hypothetical protein ACPOL_3198 [Acidisarcina polymorpha]|uniref:Uncharacterized protein n=1 Tax=Acidisarcina polymorpha TaxID=2211140 RepID=A0A2Z5FZZ3_9BACT|nr:hypothetical protein ACPOL_3198 [Acidisarcina polymorpha]
MRTGCNSERSGGSSIVVTLRFAQGKHPFRHFDVIVAFILRSSHPDGMQAMDICRLMNEPPEISPIW